MQNKKQTVFIIAGEVSGDVLGGRIMSNMPDTNFIGIGGENMTAAGLHSLFPMSDLAVMGIIDLIDADGFINVDFADVCSTHADATH